MRNEEAGAVRGNGSRSAPELVGGLAELGCGADLPVGQSASRAHAARRLEDRWESPPSLTDKGFGRNRRSGRSSGRFDTLRARA